jgi:hypothetical protein
MRHDRSLESSAAAESHSPSYRSAGTRSIESSRRVSTIAHPTRMLVRVLERRQLALTRMYLRQMRQSLRPLVTPNSPVTSAADRE